MGRTNTSRLASMNGFYRVGLNWQEAKAGEVQCHAAERRFPLHKVPVLISLERFSAHTYFARGRITWAVYSRNLHFVLPFSSPQRRERCTKYQMKGGGNMEYVAAELNPRGSVQTGVAVMRVEVRASAVEVSRGDAIELQERASKMWPDYDWDIEKTFSGKYV